MIVGVLVSAAVNYAVQVAANYAQGYRGKDAFWGNIDLIDLGVAALIGGISAGASAGVTASSSFGKGLISFAKSKGWEYGSMLGGAAITSFFDWTPNEGIKTKGFQEASGEFIFNVVTARAAFISGKAGGDLVSSTVNFSRTPSWESLKKLGGEMGRTWVYDWLMTMTYDRAIAPIVSPPSDNDFTPPNQNIPGLPNQPRQLIEQSHNSIFLQNKNSDTAPPTMVDLLKLNR